jgi:hypothetical protein
MNANEQLTYFTGSRADLLPMPFIVITTGSFPGPRLEGTVALIW